MNISFSGKIALVAGGTGGLGRAVSPHFWRKARGSWFPIAKRKNTPA